MEEAGACAFHDNIEQRLDRLCYKACTQLTPCLPNTLDLSILISMSAPVLCTSLGVATSHYTRPRWQCRSCHDHFLESSGQHVKHGMISMIFDLHDIWVLIC